MENIATGVAEHRRGNKRSIINGFAVHDDNDDTVALGSTYDIFLSIETSRHQQIPHYILR